MEFSYAKCSSEVSLGSIGGALGEEAGMDREE